MLYKILCNMQDNNTEEYYILEIFEDYYLADKKATQGSNSFLPIDALLITHASDFSKWTLSIAKHCHLDTNISSSLE